MSWTNLSDPEFTDTFLDISLSIGIATFYITERRLGAFTCGAVSLPQARALAIIQVRGHQELSILLSVDHRTVNVEVCRVY
jgi:hypothetical protein